MLQYVDMGYCEDICKESADCVKLKDLKLAVDGFINAEVDSELQHGWSVVREIFEKDVDVCKQSKVTEEEIIDIWA